MKATFTVLTLVLLCLFIASVSANSWSAINSGYAVTTDYQGKEVLPGTLVTATAGTTDTDVTHVTFIWKYPNETVAYIDPDVPVWFNGTEWKGKIIYYAQSQHIPDVIGDWGIQAFFIGEGGTPKAGIEDVIMIRATSFNVIPDLPIVGTAGALTAMLLGLGLFLKKRKGINQ